MRVLICGGRTWYDLKYSYFVLDFIHTRWYSISTLIQGGAFGADALADHWAFDRKLNREEYPADWNKFGKAAGMIRNKEMLVKGKPDLVIAFPGGKGTAGMIALARKANVKVMEIDMSELVQRIKLEQLEARKNKDSLKANLLTTLIGEHDIVMKNGVVNNDPQSTMTMLIKKFLKNISITLESRQSDELLREKEILESYLPKQLTRDALALIIAGFMSEGHTDKPSLMKNLKANYADQYDGKTANEVITEALS